MTILDSVEPDNMPLKFFQFKYGTWVDFKDPQKVHKPTWRGYVFNIKGTVATVIDEKTFGQVSRTLF